MGSSITFSPKFFRSSAGDPAPEQLVIKFTRDSEGPYIEVTWGRKGVSDQHYDQWTGQIGVDKARLLEGCRSKGSHLIAASDGVILGIRENNVPAFTNNIANCQGIVTVISRRLNRTGNVRPGDRI